jgi:subtilisin family serine protease
VRVYQFRHIRETIIVSRPRRKPPGYHRRIVRAALGVVLLAVFAASSSSAASAGRVDVIVEFGAAPVAAERGPAARLGLRTIAAAERRLLAALPRARVEHRYRRVLAGVALSLPAADARRLARLPGVVAVYPSLRYRPLGEPAAPGAVVRAILAAGLAGSLGDGMKIGVVDDGIDASHPYFDPTGYAYPAGFPKGDTAFTTPKVIVARAFAPRGATGRYARAPFDPVRSFHATHVAGIAAGNADTNAGGGRSVSGVAPRAFIGNYKALSVPMPDEGLNGNSPELVAAIEAAVADGMDVINLSLGEPEVAPPRDAVARALDGAAAAGVVPVVSAGNNRLQIGAGSIGSPGTAARAITVGAADAEGPASFSSPGPTPLGLLLKPDVLAPGVDVLSAVPATSGLWDRFSGTSMAAPAVAGAAALLRERHPDWSVAEVKSALVATAEPTGTPERGGGGLVDPEAADDPRLATAPQSLSFGLLDVSARERTASRTLALADLGGGAGVWDVQVALARSPRGASVDVPASVTVPGELVVTVRAPRGTPADEWSGWIVLARAGTVRRVPFWLRVTRPRLPAAPAGRLRRPGTYESSNAGLPALVRDYRYPEDPYELAAGPERVFRIRIPPGAANAGVAVLARSRAVVVEPRIVRGQDENRIAGRTALPYVTNPYRPDVDKAAPIAAVLFPTPGVYSIVFDSPDRAAAGRFSFRFWLNDTTPPRIAPFRLGSRILSARVTDAGAGIDPDAIRVTVAGRLLRAVRYDERTGVVRADLRRIQAGRHRVVLTVSDRQAAKNTENVPRADANTTVRATSVRLR